MGQYYIPLLIAPDGRTLTLSAHNFDNGSKLTEHSWIGNTLVGAVYSLILNSPKRVAWIGDYSKDPYDGSEDVYATVMSLDEFTVHYERAWEGANISPSLFSQSDTQILTEDTKDMYLMNHTKSLYIDMGAYIAKCTVKSGSYAGWCVNPLPLLTACGNGRGGGDYRENKPCYSDVGTWAFDLLEYTGKNRQIMLLRSSHFLINSG